MLLAGAALSFLALRMTSGRSQPAGEVESRQAQVEKLKEELRTLPDLSKAFVAVSRIIQPAVVNIVVSRTAIVRDPWDEWFDNPWFRRPPRRFKQQGQGSGIVVDPEGYVLTNRHVVVSADEIWVKMSDKREFRAELVGMDEGTDIALLRVKEKGLPAAPLGDSSSVQVGEWVLAFGNPFGLEGTVTAGIVSYRGRSHLGILDREEFIQTDCAINPGNSGGPLVNLKGEVVGINSAIYSKTGGYQGIGFAIPINEARIVMEQLRKEGRVRRAALGVRISDVDAETARAAGRDNLKGAVIREVLPDSPAAGAGLEPGDLVLRFAGEDVENANHLRRLISQQDIGKKVRIRINREGDELEIDVELREWRPE